jgi:hypothetical protein
MSERFLGLAKKILDEIITLAKQGRHPPRDQEGMAALEQEMVRALTALQELLLGPIDKGARDLGWWEDAVIDRLTNCFNAAHDLAFWTCRSGSRLVGKEDDEDECEHKYQRVWDQLPGEKWEDGHTTRLKTVNAVWEAVAEMFGQSSTELRPKGPSPSDKPSGPKKYLTRWQEILSVLGLDNNDTDKAKVRTLNEHYDGPIKMPKKGGQPRVDQAKLLAWWDGLEDRWSELGQKADNVKATTQASHNYGRGGTVVPGISGEEKKRRSKRPR